MYLYTQNKYQLPHSGQAQYAFLPEEDSIIFLKKKRLPFLFACEYPHIDSGNLGVGGWALALLMKMPGKGVMLTLVTEARNKQLLNLIFQLLQNIKKCQNVLVMRGNGNSDPVYCKTKKSKAAFCKESHLITDCGSVYFIRSFSERNMDFGNEQTGFTTYCLCDLWQVGLL